MTLLALLYVTLGFGALAALCTMILRIGAMLGDCPDTGAAARAGAVTIATGFAAIGAGGVILVGAVLPLMAEAPLVAFLLALGLASLCLGLGFTHAIATLRAVVADPAVRHVDPNISSDAPHPDLDISPRPDTPVPA